MMITGGSTRTVEARNRSLPDWFTEIRSGQLRLPRFQRYESWSHNNIGNLLENVVRGLPSGATLVLEVGDQEQFVSRPVAGAPAHSFKPNEHLLDGQQRLTALWRSFHDSYEDRTYFVYFDEEENGEPRIYGQPRWEAGGIRRPIWADDPRGVHSRGYIPLRLLRPEELGTEIKAWCRAAQPDDLEASFELQTAIMDLRQRVATYNIPFLELDATTPKDVALDVFIKMNTSFARLTAFDIIVAQFEEATGESLHDLVNQLVSEVPGVKHYVDPSDLILEVAALREDRPPTQASYQRIDLTHLFDTWTELTDAVASAVEFLEQEKIFDGERLPTVAVVRVLTALQPFVPTVPDELGNARSLLRKYLWRSSLTGRYEAAAGTASFQDFRALRQVLRGQATEGAVPAFDEEQYPLPTIEALKAARWPKTRDSLARAILNVSIAAGAHDVADDALATRDQLPKREYHHLFPAALLERADLPSGHIYRALNCALITWKTNRTIGAKEPLRYLRERVESADLGEGEIRRRLATHYVPFEELAVGGYEGLGAHGSAAERVRRDYDIFLTRRAELLTPPIEALCGGRRPTPTEA
jgi:hypothetical protein